MIIIICCICGRKTGEKEGGNGISHTYCPTCAQKEMEKLERTPNRKE